MAKAGRIGLGLWDRLVLLVAWIVTCGFVYLLGFYVGKGTHERRLGLEERVVRLPVTSQPPPEGQRRAAESDLTFYDTLAAGQSPEHRRPALPEEHSTPRPTMPSAPPPTLPAPAAAGPKAAVTVVPPTPAVVPVANPPAPAAPRPTAAAPEAAPLAAAPPARAPAPAAARPAGSGWTVQASPTRSRDEADALLRRLKARGYDVTMVRVLRDGDTWYRVQVGRFATSQQASEVMQRLREHEGVSHVFVASE
jgi:cell division protein FtsN